MTGYEHALNLHRKGLRLVPCRGKAALMKNWPELDLGEQDIEHWSAKGVNFAAICGDSLVIIDTDTDEAEMWVQQQKIQSPVMVRTGGGGFHRWFVTPADTEIHSKSAALGIKGLDVKAWRSYIMLPGSVHPETGNRYEWLPGCELGELAELPVFDARWIQHEKSRAIVNPIVNRSATIVTGKIRDVRAYIRGIASVQGQNGDKSAYTVCCFLAESGMTFDEALAEILDWNQVAAFPEWPAGELERKLRIAFKRVMNRN